MAKYEIGGNFTITVNGDDIADSITTGKRFLLMPPPSILTGEWVNPCLLKEEHGQNPQKLWNIDALKKGDRLQIVVLGEHR